MKKIYLIILFFSTLLFSGQSSATIHSIQVSNFQFTPASLNVNVGDTIHWVLLNGSHTTTSSTIPIGAASWNSNINSTVPLFEYVVTVAGTYDYFCSPHAFTGQFIAINTGITTPQKMQGFTINPIENLSTYKISYSLTHSSNVKITVLNITGKIARSIENSFQQAGDYSNTYSLNDITQGIYLIEMRVDNQRYTKRIVID